ncbi:Spo0B domain-containing protein [Virgibacillus halophilus]|uniref:Spo0B domain-containing protein n=1 Tax=Tigheibacillus halophilus TaxID=361280 RepID=A0ABU5CE67_9BACI|nr:Spo0B domain-containing protein [Virgibacillus halophilus]
METIEVLHLLRHCRHDLMNQIQLLQGYMSMNRPEKVKQKLHEMVVEADQQRKLMDLQANEFALWLLQVNMSVGQIRVSFEVNDVRENLQCMDAKLLEQTKQMFAAVEAAGDKNEMYFISMNICKPENVKATVEIQCRLSAKGIDENKMTTLLQRQGIQVKFESKEKIILTAVF